MRHLDYLKQHHKATYNRLQTEGKLNSYLYEINAQAEEMFETLITKFKQSEGITEQLKASNQLEWVGRMNNISQMAAEVINSDIISINRKRRQGDFTIPAAVLFDYNIIFLQHTIDQFRYFLCGQAYLFFI